MTNDRLIGCYERIKNLCDGHGVPVTVLEKELGFSRGSIGKMRSAKTASVERLEMIAKYFGVSTEYLMTGEAPEGYYINPETAQAAQEIFDNKELRLLFEAARDAQPEDLRAVHDMLLALKRKEQKNDIHQGD